MIDFREFKEFIKDSLGYIIVFIVVLLLFLYVISLHQVSGNSMSPTLEDGNVLILSKISYKLINIKRFDIVVLKTNEGEIYVKRIIGLPGEHIKHLNDILYVNDEMISEDFLESGINTSSFMLSDICKIDECPNDVIPKDKYLVLGDNRNDSFDSRDPDLGLVSIDNIVGKSLFRIWPII